MLSMIRDLIFRGPSQKSIHFLSPVPFRAATGKLRALYDEIDREFAFAPPLTLHSEVPELLEAVWAISREAYIAAPILRSEKEAIASAISKSNQCPYCDDVHSMILNSELSGKSAEETRTSHVTRWTDSLIAEKVGSSDSPFSPEELPYAIGTALAFQYINRMVSTFLDENPLGSAPSFIRNNKWLVENVMAPVMVSSREEVKINPRTYPSPCGPGSKSAEEFDWAKANQPIHSAFLFFARTMEDLAKKHLPAPVIVRASDFVGKWNGNPMGLSKSWIEDATQATGGTEDQKLARHILLVALGSFQITPSDTQLLRDRVGSDKILIAAAYGAYLATRRISSFIKIRGAV